jgi:Mrp family chromosome partitioning ATPase
MIYTFYSYKGGVGRSMALANVAELFYQAGLKVLMVDWDLEAPGIERFFPLDLEDALDKPGVMDMLLRYKEQMSQELPTLEKPGTLSFEMPAQFTIDVYPGTKGKGRLWLLTAGRHSREYFAEYAYSVRTFDWQDFYQNWEGELYFEWLRQQFEQMADVVLIDSRTGVTEMGGVCTYQLADTVVMFCTPNQQSIDGTYKMAQSFSGSEVQHLRRDRPLNLLIVPARIERAESDLLDEFQKEFTGLFQDFVPHTQGLDTPQLWRLSIPYVPKYSFTEAIAVRESGRASAEPLVLAFLRLYHLMWLLMLDQLAHKYPREAARRLALAFASVDPEDGPELIEMALLTEKFAESLTQFEPLTIYARGMSDLVHGDLRAAATQISKIIGPGSQVQVAGASLPIPRQVLALIPPQQLGEAFDEFVLTNMPHLIAINYKRLLDEEDWEKKIRACIQVFEYSLRMIALSLVSQYLIRDAEKVSDPHLNRMLLAQLPSRATLGTWNEVLFRTLEAYQGERNLLFMPELYDLYWDTSASPHRPRRDVRQPFERLIQIRNDLAHSRHPVNQASQQALFEESFALLRQILSYFAFLENYELIRIRSKEGEAYWYDTYTGLQVLSSSQPLTTKTSLTKGWLYLSKQHRDFLGLHPLMISWEQTEADGRQIRDTAIFDRFRGTSLIYLATVLGQVFNLTDSTPIAEFVHMVYDTIEQVKMARQEAKKLTWRLVKKMARRVSSAGIGGMRDKHRSEVYLQREETKQAFEAFLSSDKTCLVLTGKSGVGKSSFLLSLMDEYEDSSEVCTLTYNGGHISVETGLTAALAKDFAQYLAVDSLAAKERTANILFELNRVQGIENKKVVLLIDAVNENPDAKELLRQVDAFLSEADPYPWLKVVLSSRSETWQRIKQGVQLTEYKYYREEGMEELGVELQPFSVGVEAEPFINGELPRVYAKYQAAFDLQTNYEELPDEIRRLLQDPLILREAAETYCGQHLPQHIETSQLCREYIGALIRTERLQREDVRLLEHELVPLMIQEGVYTNSITSETIDQVKTTDGQSLFELVHSDEVLSNGRRVNQSYTNLVDVGILVPAKQTLDSVDPIFTGFEGSLGPCACLLRSHDAHKGLNYTKFGSTETMRLDSPATTSTTTLRANRYLSLVEPRRGHLSSI